MTIDRALRLIPLDVPELRSRSDATVASDEAVSLPPPNVTSVVLAAGAVLLQLVMSTNMLSAFGIQYDQPGGSIVVKFHPATYLTVLALMSRLAATGRPLWALEQLGRRFSAAMTFIGLFALCILYAIVTQGPNGASIYVESYVSAGLLLLVLADADRRQLRMLGRLMLGLFLLNVVLAIGETAVHRHLMPQYQGAIINPDILSEFRGLALYDHALTGAIMTQIALFLLLGMGFSAWLTSLLGAILLVGLLSFGGRTAQLTSVITLLGFGGYFMSRGLLLRTIKPGAVLLAVVGFVAIVIVMWLLLTETAVGVRTAGKLAFNDASTEARSVQWMVPGLLNFSQLMFGVSAEKMLDLIFQLGLAYPFIAIENFWLVAFLNFGVVGFTLYLTGFAVLLVQLWRMAPTFGRAALVTTILVASTSISLGKKSNILFIMTAAVIVTSAFRRRPTVSLQPSTTAPVFVADARFGLMSTPGHATTEFARALRPPAAPRPVQTLK